MLGNSPAYCLYFFRVKRHKLGDVMFVVFHNIPSLLPRLVKVSHARTPTGYLGRDLSHIRSNLFYSFLTNPRTSDVAELSIVAMTTPDYSALDSTAKANLDVIFSAVHGSVIRKPNINGIYFQPSQAVITCAPHDLQLEWLFKNYNSVSASHIHEHADDSLADMVTTLVGSDRLRCDLYTRRPSHPRTMVLRSRSRALIRAVLQDDALQPRRNGVCLVTRLSR